MADDVSHPDCELTFCDAGLPGVRGEVFYEGADLGLAVKAERGGNSVPDSSDRNKRNNVSKEETAEAERLYERGGKEKDEGVYKRNRERDDELISRSVEERDGRVIVDGVFKNEFCLFRGEVVKGGEHRAHSFNVSGDVQRVDRCINIFYTAVCDMVYFFERGDIGILVGEGYSNILSRLFVEFVIHVQHTASPAGAEIENG